MSSDEDRKLRTAFDQLGDGQQGALQVVWSILARPVHHYALSLTGSQEEADDVLGEVFWRLARAGRKLRGVENPRAYCFTAARNVARTRFRRRRLEAPLEDTGGGALSADAIAVRQALSGLPLEQRECVVLHIWGGLTFREVAALTGVSLDTAASRYRYALDKLRVVMNDERA
jgi:RNA polymerase sigma-70 factor (ECF subfamily)